MRRPSHTVIAVAAAIALTAAAAPTAQAGNPSGGTPTPGAPGIGDPLFPGSGNGGYRADHYTLDFDWQAPATAFPATTTIEATATQALSRFNLDFAGNTLLRVTVDGRPAITAREGDELVVTPARSLRKGHKFTVRVDYTADPTQQRHRDDAIETFGWIPTPDGTVIYPQPDGAKMIFPGNDHPSLRARTTVNITAADELTALSNGTLTHKRRAAPGRTRWTYDSRQPVAGQLFQLAVGKYTLIDSTAPDGTKLRDAVPPSLVDQVEQYRTLTPRHLEWVKNKLGPYPFDSYGLLVADTDLGVALETQTLSLVPKADLLGDKVNAERNMVHELVHQWTGDSVAIERWADLWLSEGHARYYERLYSEENGGANFEALMREAYRQHDIWRRDAGAPAEPTEPNLFKRMRYDGSALVFYALRAEVGDDTFAKIERAWATRERGRAASTADYIALASKVANRDLAPFLNAWVYGPKTPAMPGHPDWTVDPA
ncbi:M1 family metallopeptidase [Embleya sp. NBC_00896]|uniref:M1 family metallopeptidase n=1 Tax=Embleya sp. NBC_00896 TaxID=2975961 RepID=UPI0038653E8B|nr:M1 family metallopeptidase [Embleya sp. NBC_00896]